MIRNGESVAAPLKEDYDKGKLEWLNAVVVQFIGKAPNLSLFHRMANQLWGRDGSVEICLVEGGMFVVQLPTAAARDRVLESESWHIQNKPLLIRKWVPGIKPLNINLSKIPALLHLKGVPLELFNKIGLSHIASVIGIPLCMDSITATRKRIAYAKVCVEVDVSKEIPSSVKLILKDGSESSIEVEVPWYHVKCTNCNVFGHSLKTCSKTGKINGESGETNLAGEEGVASEDE